MQKPASAIAFIIFSFSSFAQNVGIGISNPTRAKLEINGSVGRTVGIFGGDQPGISLQNEYPSVGFNQYFDGTNSRYMSDGFAAVNWFNPVNGWFAYDVFPFGLTNNIPSTSSRALTIGGNGYLGLSGAPPNAILQLPNNMANRKIVLWETANNDNQYYGLGINAGTLRYNVDGASSAHKFYAGSNSTTSTFLMSIGGNKQVLIGQQDQGFKLGINTTTPIYTIEMVQAGNKGMGFINPQNGYHYWEIKSETYSTNVSDALTFYYDGGTSPKGWFRPTDGGYTSNSDRRLKKDIIVMENILPKILKIQPKRYHYINDKTQQDCIGFIAQDVKEIFPEIVDTRPNNNDSIPNLQGINYGSLGVVAIKAIQEQQQQIEFLKKENQEIKKQLQFLMRLFANNN